MIFGTWAIPKLLDGSKTMTRRVVKLKPPVSESGREWTIPFTNDGLNWIYTAGFGMATRQLRVKCPYGQVGDRLWVRETWAAHEAYDGRKPSDIPEGVTIECKIEPDAVETDGNGHRKIREGERGKWRPSIFMPRRASRILLEITGVRVERLNQISNNDVIKEGVDNLVTFMPLWDRLNGKRGYGWKSNCWVWVITFKLCQ